MDSSDYAPKIIGALVNGATYEKFEGGRPLVASYVVIGKRFSVSMGELRDDLFTEGSQVNGRLYLAPLCTGDFDGITGIEQIIEKERESLGSYANSMNIVLKIDGNLPKLMKKAERSFVFNKETRSVESIQHPNQETSNKRP